MMALEGVSVVEWSSGRIGAYAGKLLADFGATVVRTQLGAMAALESDRLLQEWLHGRKTARGFDTSGSDFRPQFNQLLNGADILLIDQPMDLCVSLGLEPEELARQYPRLIVVACTLAGLGSQGRTRAHSDLVASAAGGLAWRTPPLAFRSSETPPLRLGGNQADYATGLLAASAAVAHLRKQRRRGVGSLLDVSAQATVASFMRWEVAFLNYNTPPPERKERLSIHNFIRCHDGHVAVMMVEQYQWDSFKRMMGNPEWIRDAAFAQIGDVAVQWHRIEPGVLEWAARRSRDEIFTLAQSHRVPLFPLNDVDEFMRDAQQVARRSFEALGAGRSAMPGAIVHLSETPAATDKLHLEQTTEVL